jgi:hypothetical protein
LSESRFAGRSYFLEGPDGLEPLGADYDEHADVLYLWRGENPVEAISLPTDDGPVVRLHPETGELVGVTLLDFEDFWAEKDRIEIQLPSVGASEAAAPPSGAERRQLVLA